MPDSFEGRTLAHFRIQAKLGEGGMGVVYRARDERLRRTVALKLLPAELAGDEARRERFLREARAAAAVSHPAIAAIHEIGEADGISFIAMELVEGRTLREHQSGGPLSVDEVVGYASQIADALDRAHAAGVVHRDLKPDNVIMQPDGRLKLLDFGLAKLAPDGLTEARVDSSSSPTEVPNLTREGMIVGTAAYMSPEQARGREIDARSDLFSLGVMLYESLSGRNPFRAQTMADTLGAILRDRPPSVTSLNPGVPADLSGLLERLLAKSPDDRPASAREVLDTLDGCKAQGAVAGSAAPTGTSIAPARWRMVGRDAERAELRARLDEALAGRGSLTLLGGEPGIGKTRLTEELLEEAQARGCRCFVGHCYEMEGAPPYVPFVEMLEQAARVVPAANLREALGDAAPEVARLMPELRRAFPDIPPAFDLPAEQQRRFFFNAYREFVERACRRVPHAVVVEDLHWGDEPTLLLIQHLAQAFSSIPIFIIGTYRDVELEVTRPFARVLESLLRQHLATRLMLRRLPVSGVEEMLGAMSQQEPPPSLARVIHHETEGNPFFVAEVFQHLSEEGKLFDADGGWRADLRIDDLEVPEGVRLVIGRRLERLSEDARRVLTTGAVIGRTFSVPLLEALEEAQPDVVFDALEEAERSHLVVAQSEPREARYGFAHELIRQTLAERLSMPRRQRLHARIGDAIEHVYSGALEKHASALAHHFYQAGAAADPDKTSRYLVAAAEQASVAAAHEEALAHIDDALSMWEGERSAQVAELHERRGVALRSLARASEAISALRHAASLAESLGDTERLASASLALVWTLAWQGDGQAALDEAQRALPLIDRGLPLARSRLLYSLAAAHSVRGMPDEATRALEEATELRQDAADPALDALALGVEATIALHRMHVTRLETLAHEGVRACRAIGDLWGEADQAWLVGASLLHRGLCAEAARAFEASLPNAQRAGQHGAVWAHKLYGAMLTLAAGDLAAASEQALETVAYGRAHDVRWGIYTHSLVGVIAHLRGDEGAAVEQMRIAAEKEPATYLHGVCRATLFWALAWQRDEGAVAFLRQSAPRLPLAGRPNPMGAWISLQYVVEGLALVGRRDEVATLRPQAEALIDTGAVMRGHALFRVCAGIAATAAREWPAAQAHFETAMEQAATIPHRVAQPQVHTWYAEMLLDRGQADDRSRALTLLEGAAAMYATLGMPTFERRARERLASL